MPKKFLSIKETVKDVASPLVVFLSKGEVASQKTKLRAFSNGDVSFVSNIDKLHDPISGGHLPVIDNSEQVIEKAGFLQLDNLITMRCSACNTLAGVDPDLAFALAEEPIHAFCCGQEATLAYEESDDDTSSDEEDFSDEELDDSDFSDDDSEDEEFDSVDDTEEVEDDSDDVEEASAEDPAPAPVVEETIEAVTSAEKAPVVVDPTVASEQEPVEEQPAVTEQTTEVQASTEEAPAIVEPASEQPVEEPAVIEQPTENVEQEVHAVSLVDETAHVKLVTLTTDNSEIAVFVGGTHVGTLARKHASEVAAPLFDNGQKLVSAFKPVFNANRSNQTSGELAAYGYTPVTFKVNTSVLFDKRLEKEVAKVRAEANVETATKIDSMSALLELAFIGINKGIFEVKKNELVSEIASLLKRNGIANPERETRRILATCAHNYVKAGVEKAKELANNSEDYNRGITEMIAKSDFSVTEEETKTEVASVSAFAAPRKPEIASDEVVGFRSQQSKGNRFQSLISGISNRHNF